MKYHTPKQFSLICERPVLWCVTLIHPSSTCVKKLPSRNLLDSLHPVVLPLQQKSEVNIHRKTGPAIQRLALIPAFASVLLIKLPLIISQFFDFWFVPVSFCWVNKNSFYLGMVWIEL